MISVQAFMALKIRVMEGAWVEQPEEASPWDPTLFKIISFGQVPSAVDGLWIRTISDPGISHVPRGSHPRVYYDLDLATEIDPLFMELYWVGGHLLAVIRNDGLGARELLLKAEAFRKTTLPKLPEQFIEKYWSTSWQVPLLLAYVQLFELQDMRGAKIAFSEASMMEGSPKYLMNLVRRFEKPGGEYEVGLRLLKFMLLSAKDSRVRDELEFKIQSLKIGAYLFNLNAQFSEFLKKKKRNQILDSRKKMEQFKIFLDNRGILNLDPWGGKLEIGPKGQIITNTPHSIVFGLE